MFTIREEKLGPLSLIKLVNESTGEFISLIPERGACLNELVLFKDKKQHSILNGCLTYEDLLSEANKFKSSNLFPFPNRINHGHYVFKGKHYQLEKNFPKEDNAIHGLILSSSFKIKGMTENLEEANLFLEYKLNNIHNGYPFKCILEVGYTLSASGMKCTTKVTNDSEMEIPLGQGWHPYFKTGNSIGNLFLKLPSDEILEVDDRLIPSGNVKKSDEFLQLTKINNHHFDTCYKINKTANGISETELYDKANNLRIIFWQESGPYKYNFLQVYIPPDRISIALEPTTCAPDAFNNHMGLIILQPTESKEFTYGVKLK
jgi:aldose 1-epimerase